MFNVCIAIFLSFYCYDCKGNVFIRYQQTIYKFFHEKGNNFLLLAIFRIWNVTKIIKKEEDREAIRRGSGRERIIGRT